ncbi:hypothetical protein [uncultured Aquimarina sp.]|uniref:hypothetical protein n=1 Tax=uncultured Aquimarina sp. TaxID=575652 RepID=UPI0026307071|nr:hypothetical protein [uncultured Aquimarina sp.]
MLKNLKSLFIVDDSEEENKETSESTEKADVSSDKKPTASTPPPLPNNPISSSSEGVLDTKIVEKLLQAIEKNNLDGFDYLEYKKSLKALEKMPMDEATKYRSAFATASTMGVTLDKLLQTTNFYIGVLDKENEQFIGAFKNQFDSKVSGREREIAQFESIIKEKSEQIKKLTEEIAKHQNQISDLKAKVEESNSKINKTQNDFKISYSHLKAQFEEDIVKMQKYLK